MSINHYFAHMPEEALRIVATHELNMFLSKHETSFELYGDPLRARVNSLMAVAFTLDNDSWEHDDAIWRQFLAAYSFPPNLSRAAMVKGAARDHAWAVDQQGGRRKNIDYIIKRGEDTSARSWVDALKVDGVGEWSAKSTPGAEG